MKTSALVTADGTIENIVVIDDQADYTPPQGHTLVDIPDGKTAAIGGRWDGKKFTAPAAPVASADDVRLDELRTKAEAGTLAAADIADAVRLALKRRRI
jgi:hypothetical protein